MNKKLFVGIDPSGSDKNPSGICILDSMKDIRFLGKWKTISDFQEILDSFRDEIRLVAIDGPLQPPHDLDRCCFSEQSSGCGHEQTGDNKGRTCERLLIKMGYRCFLTSKNSFVKGWVDRCFRLNEFLIGQGYRTIEVFPYATRKILFPGLPGKKYQRSFRQHLQRNLSQKGYSLPESDHLYSHDELDALLAAITSRLHFLKNTELVGDERDGYIVLPRIFTR
jgi:predicted nuclease with RNAse H fold